MMGASRPGWSHHSGNKALRLGYETKGQSWRLKFWLRCQGGTEKKKEKKEKEKEKVSHMCESIGHRPLRGRCPKSMSVSIAAHL